MLREDPIQPADPSAACLEPTVRPEREETVGERCKSRQEIEDLAGQGTISSDTADRVPDSSRLQFYEPSTT